MSKYTWVKTQDGSPSLQIELTGAVERAEKMHSWEGAYSETQYVYGEVIRTVCQAELPLRVFSLGLGLGYNEILAASEVAAGTARLDYGVSTELDPWLIKEFRKWLSDQKSELEVPYNEILNLFAAEKNQRPEDIKAILTDWVSSGVWKLDHGYGLDFDFYGRTFNAILYDAFSDKVSPELWTQEILDKTLQSADPFFCVFGTYASKGILKRSLKATGFHLLDRTGYGGKKESTLATRGRLLK